MFETFFAALQLLTPFGLEPNNFNLINLPTIPESFVYDFYEEADKRLNEKELEIFNSLSLIEKITYAYDCFTADNEAQAAYGEYLCTNYEGDAFRHTYWSAMLTDDFGRDLALKMTYAHEWGNNPNDLSTKMDFHNDLNGTLLYEEFVQELDETNTLKNFIIHCVTNGETYNVIKLNNNKTELVFTTQGLSRPDLFGLSFHHDVIRNVDFGFEQQYFFYNKNKECTTFANEIIQTSRLRTGYIEEEYIVLSPKRNGAGRAIFNIEFSKPISHIDFDLCFWSENENFISSDFGRIFFFEEDMGFEVLSIFDDLNLPTDRTNPYHLSLDFEEPKYSVQFVMFTSAEGSRNKGRLCIGDIYLTYCR